MLRCICTVFVYLLFVAIPVATLVGKSELTEFKAAYRWGQIPNFNHVGLGDSRSSPGPVWYSE